MTSINDGWWKGALRYYRSGVEWNNTEIENNSHIVIGTRRLFSSYLLVTVNKQFRAKSVRYESYFVSFIKKS